MRNLGILLICLSFILNSCVSESPLSDVDVDDPSVIKPVIEINKSYTPSVSFLIKAEIFDKNGNPMELKNGGVTIDGVRLQLKKDAMDLPYYNNERWDLLKFQYNKTYDVSVIMSDGVSYNSKVTSRPVELHALNTPVNHSKQQPLIITWGEYIPGDIVSAELTIYSRQGNSSSTGWAELQIPNNKDGFEIPRQYFTDPAVYKLDILLISTSEGQINGAFQKGSSITSSVKQKKSINITN